MQDHGTEGASASSQAAEAEGVSRPRAPGLDWLKATGIVPRRAKKKVSGSHSHFDLHTQLETCLEDQRHFSLSLCSASAPEIKIIVGHVVEDKDAIMWTCWEHQESSKVFFWKNMHWAFPEGINLVSLKDFPYSQVWLATTYATANGLMPVSRFIQPPRTKNKRAVASPYLNSGPENNVFQLIIPCIFTRPNYICRRPTSL